jgi:polyisoprenoid-binding protein YceI
MIMKKTYFLLSFLALGFTASMIAGNLHVDVYNVDTQSSSVHWFAEKVTGKHDGAVTVKSGQITNNHGKLGGSFEIDMTSIKVRDIEDEKMNAKLTNHLKSDDFFNAETFPVSKFVITSITPLQKAKESGETHTVKGNLTIHDKTNEISFDAAIIMQQDKVTCVGTAVVDRSKYNVKYGSKSFFADIGDKMIYDEFKIKFNVIATK